MSDFPSNSSSFDGERVLTEAFIKAYSPKKPEKADLLSRAKESVSRLLGRNRPSIGVEPLVEQPPSEQQPEPVTEPIKQEIKTYEFSTDIPELPGIKPVLLQKLLFDGPNTSRELIVSDEQAQSALDILKVVEYEEKLRQQTDSLVNTNPISQLHEHIRICLKNSQNRFFYIPNKMRSDLMENEQLRQKLADACRLSANLEALTEELSFRERAFEGVIPEYATNPLGLPKTTESTSIPINQILFWGNTKFYHTIPGSDLTPEQSVISNAFRALEVIKRGNKSAEAEALFQGQKIDNEQLEPIEITAVRCSRGFVNGSITNGRHRVAAAVIAGLSTVHADVTYAEALDTFIEEPRGKMYLYEGTARDGKRIRGLSTSPSPDSHDLPISFLNNPITWQRVTKPNDVMVNPEWVQLVAGGYFTGAETSRVIIKGKQADAFPQMILMLSGSKPSAQFPLSTDETMYESVGRMVWNIKKWHGHMNPEDAGSVFMNQLQGIKFPPN